MEKTNFLDLGHQVQNLIINLENEITEGLEELITDYTVKTNINYNFKLVENTLDDNLNFRITLTEGSKTKIKIEFNCMSPTLIFKNTLLAGIAEIINNDMNYNDLINIMKYDRLALLDDFTITDRR